MPFHPVSLILYTANNTVKKENNVHFENGMSESHIIKVSKDGASLKFSQAGSYRLELNGLIRMNGPVRVKLYNAKFSRDINKFTEFTLNNNNINVSTILHLEKNHKISVIFSSDVTITELRFLINRVA